MLVHTPWDLCFVPNDIERSLSNWYDMFISAVNENIPKCTLNNVNDPLWMDTELRVLLRKKTMQRIKATKSQLRSELEKYKQLRKQSKQLIRIKKNHVVKMKNSIMENPKRFWSYVKSVTKVNQQPNFLRDEDNFVSDPVSKANLLNHFFTSAFSSCSTYPSDISPTRTVVNQITEIQLTVPEVAEVLRSLDAYKASGPDCIPNKLLVNVADEIAPSICRLFNLSLSLGVMPENWKLANITAVFKKMTQQSQQTTDPFHCLIHYPKF